MSGIDMGRLSIVRVALAVVELEDRLRALEARLASLRALEARLVSQGGDAGELALLPDVAGPPPSGSDVEAEGEVEGEAEAEVEADEDKPAGRINKKPGAGRRRRMKAGAGRSERHVPNPNELSLKHFGFGNFGVIDGNGKLVSDSKKLSRDEALDAILDFQGAA